MSELETPQKKRNLGGRPRKLDDEIRSYVCQVGLNEFEFQKLCERAESVGLNSPKRRAEFVRKLITNAKINSIAPASKEAVFELNRIGQNLNQLLKIAHQTQQIDTSQIDQIQVEIKAIGQRIFEGENT